MLLTYNWLAWVGRGWSSSKSGVEGRIMTRPFQSGGFFRKLRKLTPNSLLFHPTTSASNGYLTRP